MKVSEKILLKKILIVVSVFLSTSLIIAYGIVRIWKYSNFIFVVTWIIIFIIMLACGWFMFIKSVVIDRKFVIIDRFERKRG